VPGFSLHERIERPPEEVFDLLADMARAPEWLPEIVRVEPVSDSPLAPGSRVRETRRVMGREATAELEIVAAERPSHWAVSNTTSGVETIYRYRLIPIEGGTDIELACTVEGRGVRKLSASLLATMMKRQDRAHLTKLKHAVEGSAAAL
jgi:uncharacterized protein YndB with AHSA1/START domain